MTRFIEVLIIFFFLIVTKSSASADTNPQQLVQDIDARDHHSACHLAVRKVFEGDTDRGMEASFYDCSQGVERIEITFGLSRKDLIFRCLLVNQRAVKAKVLERKYRSTADGDPDFKNPLPSELRGILYFDGVRPISVISAGNLGISEKNKNDKAVAFINLVNAVRAALMSSDAHPEFESTSFLTGIFGNR